MVAPSTLFKPVTVVETLPLDPALLNTGDGLIYLETPAQYSTRSGKTVSERTHHVIASLGDWRTINENSRFIGSSQDVVRGDTATLYGPRMELIVNNNVYGPVSGDSAVTSYHFGLRAEDYVVDAQSDGAVKGSLMKLTGEKDAANTNLAVGSGDATGVVFVDATPPLNTQTSTVASGGTANNRNNDGSITLHSTSRFSQLLATQSMHTLISLVSILSTV